MWGVEGTFSEAKGRGNGVKNWEGALGATFEK